MKKLCYDIYRMASVTNKKQPVLAKRVQFEPIIIEIDGKEVEICACGQTKNEDRTCDGTHNKLNAQIENDGKTMTIEEALSKLNLESESEKHECACGGQCSHDGQNCGCGNHG